jgi:hypothetical protein
MFAKQCLRADCVFSHLGPDVPNIRVMHDDASGAFHKCTFRNFVAKASSVGVLQGSGNSGLLIKEASFQENIVDAVFVASDNTGKPRFYSDSSDAVVYALSGNHTKPLPLEAVGNSSIQFLDGNFPSTTVMPQVQFTLHCHVVSFLRPSVLCMLCRILAPLKLVC